MPSKPAGLRRDREWERNATREVAIGLNVDPEPLIVFAEKRADMFQGEYGHDFPSLDRDLVREALDEIGDGRNYVVWELEKVHRGLAEGGDRVAHLQRALRHATLMFEELRRAL